MYLQAVGIEVIGRAIALDILVTPAIQGVLRPVERVLVVLLHLPSAVVLLLGLLGSHHTAQILAEVGCRAQLVVYTAILEHERGSLQRVALGSSEAIVLLHLREHHITSDACSLVAAYGVIER